MIVLDLAFDVYQFIGSIKELGDIASVVLLQSESATWVEVFEVVDLQNLVVHYNKLLLLIKHFFFQSLDRHLWLSG